ncbi:ead/Ea22-like family protein [Pseudomonas aeruginosa]|uniref:ead/Ea22-like family protein n=1 Tax=Pseudomonas aeruginosa TaxID=287 RepID=UPI00398376A6
MTDHAELRRLAKAATPGEWHAVWEEGDDAAWANLFPIIQAENGETVIGNEGFYSDLEQDKANAQFCAAANPKTILALLDEIDGMKASGWRNHSVNYARAEKCPQTLETAQAAWDRDQELIEEQRQQIARDSQTINKLRQKLQSAEVDRDRLKAELEQSASVLPGNYYMDPPDGGNVSIPEQIRRMAKDAERYRWLRDRCTRQWDVMCRDIEIVINGDGADECEDLDGIIDAALEGATQ